MTKFNFSSKTGSIYLVDVPYDASTSYKPGARFAGSAIREASMNLEPYSPYVDKSLENVKFVDLGSIPFHANNFEGLRSDYYDIANISLDKVITIGGEHSISIFPISQYLQKETELILIHLDAHTDLRDEYHGDKNSHACVIRRAVDLFGPGHSLIQYGIRSGSKEEFQWMEENRTLCHSRKEFLDKIASIPSNKPIYLTLDLDYFDPGIMPGTGTPEAGGEDFHSFISLIKILKHKNLVGADVVELAPKVDPTGISEAMAAKIIRELILTMDK